MPEESTCHLVENEDYFANYGRREWHNHNHNLITLETRNCGWGLWIENQFEKYKILDERGKGFEVF